MRNGMSVPLAAIVLGLAATGCAQAVPDDPRTIGGGCDGCELIFEGMPSAPGSEATIAGPDEPGEPMVIEGVIYHLDGETPAPGVVLYVYQTDATGHYAPAPHQTLGRRHGRLRGWVKTDADGRYKLRTIRPASYPDAENPAHIHPIVKEPGKNEYYLDEYIFDDDPLLTESKRSALEGRGGSGIVELTKDADGVWHGRRDVILGRNVPDYR